MRHELERGIGGITCRWCPLDVVKPDGMPDYSRVGATRVVSVG